MPEKASVSCIIAPMDLEEMMISNTLKAIRKSDSPNSQVMQALGLKIIDGEPLPQAGGLLPLCDNPANIFAAEFWGTSKMNFFPARLLGSSLSISDVVLPNGQILLAMCDAGKAAVGAEVTLGIRPAHLQLEPADEHANDSAARLLACVCRIEILDEQSMVYLDVEGLPQNLRVEVSGRSQLRCGEMVGVYFPLEHCLLFDPIGYAFPRPPMFYS